MRTIYEVHRLTGWTLIDARGRSMGNESAGRVSWHRTRDAAERKISDLLSVGIDYRRNYEIREVSR